MRTQIFKELFKMYRNLTIFYQQLEVNLQEFKIKNLNNQKLAFNSLILIKILIKIFKFKH